MNEQERAEFEAWAASIGFCVTGKYAGTIAVLCAESAFKAGYRAALSTAAVAGPVDERGALRALVAAVEAEVNPEWVCNSYHPALLPALDRARAALIAACDPDTIRELPAERDAARYRWLRERVKFWRTSDGNGAMVWFLVTKVPASSSPQDETDAAIDQSIAAQKGDSNG